MTAPYRTPGERAAVLRYVNRRIRMLKAEAYEREQMRDWGPFMVADGRIAELRMLKRELRKMTP